MKLSLSVRVAEKFQAKREANMTLEELATLAAHYGYQALCMRASQVGTHSPAKVVAAANTLLAQHHLAISMVTGDFPIPENSDQGPLALRNITPYLDLAHFLAPTTTLWKRGYRLSAMERERFFVAYAAASGGSPLPRWSRRPGR